MAPHSSTLAWKIPWMEEPGRLYSMGSLRVRHNWATSLSLFTFMHWRRKWQPTPVFLPGESQGRGSLVGFCIWGHRESDTTEESFSTNGLHQRNQFLLIVYFPAAIFLSFYFLYPHQFVLQTREQFDESHMDLTLICLHHGFWPCTWQRRSYNTNDNKIID